MIYRHFAYYSIMGNSGVQSEDTGWMSGRFVFRHPASISFDIRMWFEIRNVGNAKTLPGLTFCCTIKYAYVMLCALKYSKSHADLGGNHDLVLS